jgi:hypothetical protein
MLHRARTWYLVPYAGGGVIMTCKVAGCPYQPPEVHTLKAQLQAFREHRAAMGEKLEPLRYRLSTVTLTAEQGDQLDRLRGELTAPAFARQIITDYLERQTDK